MRTTGTADCSRGGCERGPGLRAGGRTWTGVHVAPVSTLIMALYALSCVR